MESRLRLYSSVVLSVMISCVGVLVLNQFGQHTVSRESKSHMKLIVISLDGFRWDYIHGRARTPTFETVKERGVHAKKGMTSSFISNTLPNHLTLVTGLHPESHGMLDNMVYDQDLDSVYVPIFYYHNIYNDPRWYSGMEPIWVSNQIQRKDARSGLLLWMAGEAPMKGVLPHRYIPHTYYMDEMIEMKHLIDWMMDEREPIDLALAYFPEPDSLSHVYGPDSVEVTRKIEDLDGVLQYLLHQLDATGLSSVTNVIVLSDHGFTTISEEKTINVDDLLDRKWYTVITPMPASTISVFPNKGYLDIVYDKLKESADTSGLFKTYKAENIPERFHLKNHKRVPPIVAVATMNYSFVSNEEINNPNFYKGNHGYDNMDPLMRPIFMALGPSFKKNVTLDNFRNVDVYPLMCHLLGIEPHPHNGSLEASSHALREDPSYLPSWTDLLSRFALCQTAVTVFLLVINFLVKKNFGQSSKRFHCA